MLIYSMSVSVDGFIADREGAFGWTDPSEEQFRFHLAQTRELGGYLCGRRLYETMLVWETNPSLATTSSGRVRDVWCALPKVESDQAHLGKAAEQLCCSLGYRCTAKAGYQGNGFFQTSL
jgi:hypothetical protein